MVFIQSNLLLCFFLRTFLLPDRIKF